MRLILEDETKEDRADYREDTCAICGEDCNPHYRISYYTKEKDNKGNALISDEICCCNKCYPKVKAMFKDD